MYNNQLLVQKYLDLKWSLVPIPMCAKAPQHIAWNAKENAIESAEQLNDLNVGLAHAYSGTMALDIDEWQTASVMLGLWGINLQSLYDAPDAVIIDSGRQGRGKLLYKMPNGLVLPSKKLITTMPDGHIMNYLDFRCATVSMLTVQDVLPPSIHPDTLQPYRWAGAGHFSKLPEIPMQLLKFWQSLVNDDHKKTFNTNEIVAASWTDIRSAIEFISPDVDRQKWVTIGMALHWAGSQTNQLDQACVLWNEWSSAGDKYKGEREIVMIWRSFKSDHASAVTLGSFFHYAKQAGWQRPAPDVTALFANINAKKSVINPTQIMNSVRPPPPDIDLDLFPEVIRRRAMEVSTSVGGDPLVPLWSGLAAACGVVDARTRLELMDGFQVPPVLWIMTIGEPSDKKSPTSKPILRVLKEIELEDRPRYQKELLDWEGKEAGYASAKKAFLDYSASPEALLGGQAPHVPDLPKQPVPLKITVNDVTSQKLVRLAADRPRGLLCYLDEMNSWVEKINSKTSGEDRSCWVVSYESDYYEMDRVGAGSIHADNLAISIYGNMQPEVLRDNFRSLAKDGLLQRFIPIQLRSDKSVLGHPIAEELTNNHAWQNTLRLIYALPVQTYRLSEHAYIVFRQFQTWYEDAKKEERLLMSSSTFMTAFGKLEGTCGRLILMFHIIENPFSIVVDADIVKRVVTLIKSYIIPSFRYVLNDDHGSASSFDKWLIDYIIHNCERPSITLSEIKRSARRQIEGTVWQQDHLVLSQMMVLEAANWVIRTDDGSKENQHHAEWAINPALHGQFIEYRRAVASAKAKRFKRLSDQ